VERHSPPPIDYRALLESTPLVPWELDAATSRLVYVGPQARDLLGYPLDDWLDVDFWRKRVLPDDQAALTDAREALSASGGTRSIEYRMEHADGHLVWVSETATCGSGPNGSLRIRGMLCDVTERKRLEERRAEDEQRLRSLLQSAPDAMVFTEADGTVVNMNDQAGYLLGYELDEIRGSSIDLLVTEGDRGRLTASRTAFLEDRERRTLVDGQPLQVQRSDGERVPVEISVSVVLLRGSRQLLYSFRDVTARMRIEQQLYASQATLRGMADALSELVCFVDADQRYRFVNEAYARFVGWDPIEMEGRTVLEVVGPAIYEQIRPSIEAALSGVAVRFGGTADIAGAIHAGRAADVTYVPRREGDVVTGYFVVVRGLPPDAPGPWAGDERRRA